VHELDGAYLVDIEDLAQASADAPMAADVDAVRRIISAEVPPSAPPSGPPG